MDKLTDFELKQLDQQLVHDKTTIQVRKLVEEVKEYRQLEKEIGCPLEKAVKMLLEFQERFGTDDRDYDVGDFTESCEVATFDEEDISCESEEHQKNLVDFIRSVFSSRYENE